MSDARDIYQAHLDVVSQALWERDFELITDLKTFPHVMRYPDEKRVYNTAEELVVAMEALRDKLEGLGATGYHRVCDQASFDPLDTGRITGSHWTYILRGGNYLSEPYHCKMVLRQRDGVWRTSDIAIPSLRHGIPTPKQGSARQIGPIQ